MSMRIAIDLDGTITKHRWVFRDLIKALQKDGWYVEVVTACAGEIPIQHRQAEAERRVDVLRISCPVRWINQNQKAAYYKSQGFDVVIEDTPETLVGLNPNQLKLLVL